MELTGLHHVTAVTGDAPGNLAFYTKTLGLRLVKKTVNQDDVSAYHLFYGDDAGHAGTELTFFDWPSIGGTQHGTGDIAGTALRVPSPKALDWWAARLTDAGVTHDGITERGGRLTLEFTDFEGQRLSLVDDGGAVGGTPWAHSPVPAEFGVKGLDGVALTVRHLAPTAAVLTDVLGMRVDREYERDGQRVTVFTMGSGGPGTELHITERPDLPRTHVGAGGVHHVAFRTPNDEEQAKWWERIRRAGLATSELIDRFYFHSLYFREPNGILFEIATDGPGFATDEDPAHLGEGLALPPFLEPRRRQIEARSAPVGQHPRGDTMTAVSTEFVHVFRPGPDLQAAPTLLLLHGTGGNERDLLELGQQIAPSANLLGVRGQVSENGMPRFFRRLAEGIFDEEDLRHRTHELADFLPVASERHGFDPTRIVALGYSNGANIAGGLLLLRPGILAGAGLLRPMVPLTPEALPDLNGVPVLISAGSRDPLIPTSETERLTAMLRRTGADVTPILHPASHGLTHADVQSARDWFSHLAV